MKGNNVDGHGLGLKIIAEDAETREKCSFLKSIKCDYAQIYFFSKPLLVNYLNKKIGSSVN
jgi:EAL domain-containing protein (putative c-di-GMP-specific phosphodiesterase class I)